MLLRLVINLLHFSINWLELTLFTLTLYTLSWLPCRLTRHFYFSLFRLWCNSFVQALGVRLYLHQKNTRPLPEQYILIANHPSAFEDIGIPALFNVHSLAKAEVADWWWVGRITRAADNLFVQRESRKSRQLASEQISRALQDGKNIAIYPEGGCKGRRIFESFRYGAFDISLQSGVAILPVFLHYESQDDFEWRSPQTLPQKIWHIMTTRNRRINYYIYDALDPAAFSNREEYSHYAHDLFLQWQQRYLD